MATASTCYAECLLPSRHGFLAAGGAASQPASQPVPVNRRLHPPHAPHPQRSDTHTQWWWWVGREEPWVKPLHPAAQHPNPCGMFFLRADPTLASSSPSLTEMPAKSSPNNNNNNNKQASWCCVAERVGVVVFVAVVVPAYSVRWHARVRRSPAAPDVRFRNILCDVSRFCVCLLSDGRSVL